MVFQAGSAICALPTFHCDTSPAGNTASAAPAQPLDGLFQGFQISLGRRCRLEGIYEKTMFVKLGNSLEQRVGHHTYIRPDARQERAQGGAIEHSERMVGDGYQRAFCGDAFEVSGLELQIHLHLFQQRFQAKAVRSRAGALVQLAHFGHGNQLARKSRESGKLRRPCPKTLPPVTCA